MSFAFNQKFFEQFLPYFLFEKLASAGRQDFVDTLKQPHFCSCFSVSAPCCRRRGPRRLRDCGFRNSRNPSLVFGRSSSPNRSSGFGLANGVSGNPLWRLIPDLAGDGCKKEAAAFLQLLLCVSAVLSSRAVASQVLSPLMSLTSVFGMGTGGPSSLLVLTCGVFLHTQN